MQYLAILYLFCYRMLTFRSPFAALSVNPTYYLSALFQISKSSILETTDTVDGLHPAPYVILNKGSSLGAVMSAQKELDCQFPIVIKPDVGERGFGVFVVREASALEHAVEAQVGDFFVQRFVGGDEFGVFMVRDPAGSQLHLTIGRKYAPRVIGDGKSNLRELIEAQHPGYASYLIDRNRSRLDIVAKEGEKVQLDDVLHGFRGTVQEVLKGDFSDSTLMEQLEQFCEKNNYNYGRIDYRAEDLESLLAGKGYILEVNGLASLPPQLSAPGTSGSEKFRVMRNFWERAYAIGDHQISNGAKRYGLSTLVAATYRHLAYRLKYLRNRKRESG